MHEVGACLLHETLPHVSFHLTSCISSLLPLNAFSPQGWKDINLGPTSPPFPLPRHPTVHLVPCSCPVYLFQPLSVADSAPGSWTAPHLHTTSGSACAVPPFSKPSEGTPLPNSPSLNVSACPTRQVSIRSHLSPFPDSPQAG